jgi:hypothetical protein
MLYGSSLLPATIRIGRVDVQLGEVVRRAHAGSGLTVVEWNALESLQREGLLARAVYEMRAEVEKEQG